MIFLGRKYALRFGGGALDRSSCSQRARTPSFLQLQDPSWADIDREQRDYPGIRCPSLRARHWHNIFVRVKNNGSEGAGRCNSTFRVFPLFIQFFPCVHSLSDTKSSRVFVFPTFFSVYVRRVVTGGVSGQHVSATWYDTLAGVLCSTTTQTLLAHTRARQRFYIRTFNETTLSLMRILNGSRANVAIITEPSLGLLLLCNYIFTYSFTPRVTDPFNRKWSVIH